MSFSNFGYVTAVVHPQLEEIKHKYFRAHPDEPIIFHRKEMMSGYPPFEGLKDPQTRANFDRDLLRLMTDWNYTVISVCLDKKKHKETYTTWRYDPYHYCLAVLLERFIFYLKRRNAQGDAIAESRGGKEDRRLKDSFERLWRREYLQWAAKVVEGCRGSNASLEHYFEEKLQEAWSKLGRPGDPIPNS